MIKLIIIAGLLVGFYIFIGYCFLPPTPLLQFINLNINGIILLFLLTLVSLITIKKAIKYIDKDNDHDEI